MRTGLSFVLRAALLGLTGCHMDVIVIRERLAGVGAMHS